MQGAPLMCRGMHNKPTGTDCREKFGDRDWCSLEPAPVDALRKGGNLICLSFRISAKIAGNPDPTAESGLWGTKYRTVQILD